MTAMFTRDGVLPSWLPENARTYLIHTEDGIPIRELARAQGCHASTVLRRVRRYENRRDDPLVDEALDRLGRLRAQPDRPETTPVPKKDDPDMTAHLRKAEPLADAATVDREARRILRRLCEPDAVLAIAPDMDKAVVLRGAVRLAVLDRAGAQAFALKDWIAVNRHGRVTTYETSGAGRAALKRLLSADTARREPGFAEAQAPFAEQHRVWAERDVMDAGATEPRRMRYNLAESPLAVLARRRDKDGQPFLTPELVAVGERLREDFELAQIGPRITQNWDRFLTGGERGSMAGD